MRRRSLLAATLAAAVPARAEEYPVRPIRVVVAWPAGGGVDTPTRLVAPFMGRLLGQPLVLDNKGGASGTIGEAEAARAAPDGYTLLSTGLGLNTNNMLFRNLSYDAQAAFTPVGQIAEAPVILVVRADHPARSLAGLLAMMRARPGQLSYFSSGIAGGLHMTSLVLLNRAGVTATHVPYRGGSQSIAGVMGGDTDWGFSTLPQAVPLVREGLLRALAISSPARLPGLPEVPTVAEQGFPGFNRAEAASFWAPTGTPAQAIARVQQALVAALAEPEVRSRLETIGMTPVGSTPVALAASSAEYRIQAAEMIRREGMRLD
jgi:tripartite-type tricarboxylate transporter receptor subunit TctC